MWHLKAHSKISVRKWIHEIVCSISMLYPTSEVCKVVLYIR